MFPVSLHIECDVGYGSIRTRKAKLLNAIILVALNFQIFGLEFIFENFHISQELLSFQSIKHQWLLLLPLAPLIIVEEMD